MLKRKSSSKIEGIWIKKYSPRFLLAIIFFTMAWTYYILLSKNVPIVPRVLISEELKATNNLEPIQIENNHDQTIFRFKDLSFKIPFHWWSRTVEKQPNWDGAFQIHPEKMCWLCDGGSEISIRLHPDTDLEREISNAIDSYGLTEMSRENIQFIDGSGVLLTGMINRTIAKGGLFKILYIQNNKDLYSIDHTYNRYPKEFDYIISSLKILKK